MKIAYIDPVSEIGYFEELVIEMRAYKETDTVLDYFCLEEGGDSLEYLTYEAVLGKAIIKKVKSLEAEYDAAIIGCFFDPFVEALKECCKDIVIVGVCEAAMKIAASLGKKISIIAPQQKHAVIFEEIVHRYCPPQNLASIAFLDFHINQLQENPDSLTAEIRRQIIFAMKTHMADVIILGCTMETGQFRALQRELEVPVIDSTVAALKYAEMMVSCRQKCGWTVSESGAYRTPPAETLQMYIK